MSLIGIDLGPSAIKVGACALDGRALASAREVPASRPAPGHREVDVRRSRDAFWVALAAVAADPSVRADPPIAVAFSSSGHEVFPVSSDPTPPGPYLMTADVRGDEVAARTARPRSPVEWFALTGHVPRRMDPVNRAPWWRDNHSDVVATTRWFMNWHEYCASVRQRLATR
jgi:sugar (pentulose or hexulose) kinase